VGHGGNVGNWPGQTWLTPVSIWDQIPPGNTSGNGDVIVLAIVAVLGIGLALVPCLPEVRDLPKRLGITEPHRPGPAPKPKADPHGCLVREDALRRR
jgi:hypothetical protein